MQISFKKQQLTEVKDELLCVAVLQNLEFPKELSELTKTLRKEEFEGKVGQAVTLTTLGKLSFKKLLLYGLGEEKDFNLDFVRRFAGTAIRVAIGMKSDNISIALPKTKGVSPSDFAQAIVEASTVANYKCIKFKSKKDDYFEVKQITVVGTEDVSVAVQKGFILGTAQNYVRDNNENPANIATPQKLAELAQILSKEKGFAIEVLGKEEMKKKGMNAILGVNQGSPLPPVMVLMEYNKDKKNLPLYSVVGKGITFDSGGISIKPAKGMQEMKYDKTGAITTLGIMKAVAELKLQIRLIGAFTATENMPSGTAQRPGDIVTSYNGKTIEVLNTDAEGRLILADTLAYVAERKPEYMIDLATLTGAIIVALGRFRIGLFSNDDKLAIAIFDAGEHTFERVWRMPLDQEYSDMDKGDFADVKNIGSESGDAGSITAACFLKEFIGETKWAHLDIAAVDAVEKHPYLDKGASGIGLRLVVETLERLAKK
ncbi:MAG: leucyl aminopeptidase [Candidatus Micrarchaeota archaeon]|nr:leucyl aminopeptidase [Candidatus Micrarchaeota archaeon]